jgi:hypothetical protein
MSQDEQDLQLGKLIRERRERTAKVKMLQGRVREITGALSNYLRDIESFIHSPTAVPTSPEFTWQQVTAVLEELRVEARELDMITRLVED